MRRSTWLAILAATIAAAALLPEHTARAQTKKRSVAVVNVSADDAANAGIVGDLKRAMRKLGTYNVKNLHAVLNAGGEDIELGNLQTADAFFKAGLAALKGGNAEEASEQFGSAADLMAQAIALMDDPRRHGDALLYLGASLLAEGSKKAALEAMKRAAIVKADPSRVDITEKAKALLIKAEQKVDKLTLGAVQIETIPGQAEVFVDGRYKGISPVTVAGLRAGAHHIGIRKVGYARKSLSITMASEDEGTKTIELSPARRKALYDPLVTRLGGEIDKLEGERPTGGEGTGKVGTMLLADTALVVRITGKQDAKKVECFMFDAASKFMVRKFEKTVDWSYRNRKAIMQLAEELLDFDYDKELAGPQDDVRPVNGDSDGIENQWWFWTIIGVVVLGGAAAVIVLTLPEEQGPAYSKDGSGAVVISF